MCPPSLRYLFLMSHATAGFLWFHVPSHSGTQDEGTWDGRETKLVEICDASERSPSGKVNLVHIALAEVCHVASSGINGQGGTVPAQEQMTAVGTDV